MALAVIVWLGCTVVGLALVDLDAGPRLVSLSQGHGVSVIDAVGLAVLAAGWSRLVIVARLGGYELPAAQRRWSAVAAAAAGVALVLVTLALPDFVGRQYAVGVLLVLLESAAAAAVLARRRA